MMPRIPFDLEARKPYLVQAFSDAEYARRGAARCEAMQREGLDALCVYGNAAAPSAVAYLTNYAPAFGNAFVVLHADRRMAVITDAVLHGEPMHSMIWSCRVPDVRVALGPIYGGPQDEVAVLAADAAGGGSQVGLAGARHRPIRRYAGPAV